MPKVSIIIPTFNCALYIPETIESVLEQTYKDFEIIVIDDGSTDNTKEVLKPYIERGIVEYIYQKNQGVAAARNNGIISSKGDYIAFLDADDLWMPDKIRQQVQAFQQYAEAGLAFTDYLKFDESAVILQSATADNGRVQSWVNKHKGSASDLAHGWIYRESLWGNCMHTSSVIVRRDIFQEVGLFDGTFKTCEDYDLWFRIAHKYQVAYVDHVFCKYRYRTESLSGPYDIRELRWGLDSARVLEKHLANNWVPLELKDLAKRILGHRYWDLGWHYFSRNLFKESRLLFFHGTRYQCYRWKSWLYWSASFLPLPIIEVVRQARRNT